MSMREWCACGAAIRSRSYKRVLEWRDNHNHPGRAEPEEPEKNGAYADAQLAHPRYFETDAIGHYDPIVTAKTVGFQAR